MSAPCEPYCSFLDLSLPPNEPDICDICGSAWLHQPVTEIQDSGDIIERYGWVRLTCDFPEKKEEK